MITFELYKWLTLEIMIPNYETCVFRFRLSKVNVCFHIKVKKNKCVKKLGMGISSVAVL